MSEYWALGETILTCGLALGMGLLIQPMWIRVAIRHGWVDIPHGRKQHPTATPLMGGIGILLATLIAAIGVGGTFSWEGQAVIWICGIGLMGLGVFDDLKGMKPQIKLTWQLLMAMFAGLAGFRLESFLGFGTLTDIPLTWQMPLTLIFLLGITNAYNMLDGMDGLAASLGIAISLGFGVLFFANGDRSFALMAVGLMGALSAFWYYNRTPARLFMGDAGSLFVGFLLAIFALRFLQHEHIWFSDAANRPIVVVSMLIIPILDITQVMGYRISMGRSPLAADRNHLHHLLQRAGWQATSIPWLMIGITAMMVAIGVAGMILDLDPESLLLLELGVAYWGISALRRRNASAV
ncbi:MAG: MraY family glycosyltransferase [Bacteroidota bacterium]